MTTLRQQLGMMEWGGANYSILLKDMEPGHLANCELLCARKVKEFAELGVKPCEYRGLFHHEWQVLFKAQRTLVARDNSEQLRDNEVWSYAEVEVIQQVLNNLAVRNMCKLKELAQAAADAAYKRAMESQARQYIDKEWLRECAHHYF